MREILSVPFEIKFVGDLKTGQLEGFGAVYGNTDEGGDMFASGAFALALKKLQAGGRVPSMYMQHGAMMGADPRPVGVWDSIEENAKGLQVKGHLVGLETDAGRYNHALVREGAMTGLSVGYRTIKADYPSAAGQPRRVIKEADLFEISIVDQPMNTLARIAQVKACDNIREFETALRNHFGLSARAAKRCASAAWDALGRGDDSDELEDLADRIRNNTRILQSH